MSDSRSLSRKLAATGLIAAPILFLASFAFEPSWADEGTAYLAEVAGSEGRHAAWAGLFALGALFLFAGLLGTARLLRGPRGAVGQVGALAFAVSAAVMAGLILAIGVTEIAMVDAAADRGEMAALWDRTEEVVFGSVVFGIVWFGGIVLGTLALAVGLVLRRIVPLWSPLLLVGWLATMFFVESQVGSAIGSLLLLGALAPLARRIATLTDEEWGRWQPLPDVPRGRTATHGLRSGATA